MLVEFEIFKAIQKAYCADFIALQNVKLDQMKS